MSSDAGCRTWQRAWYHTSSYGDSPNSKPTRRHRPTSCMQKIQLMGIQKSFTNSMICFFFIIIIIAARQIKQNHFQNQQLVTSSNSEDSNNYYNDGDDDVMTTMMLIRTEMCQVCIDQWNVLNWRCSGVVCPCSECRSAAQQGPQQPDTLQHSHNNKQQHRRVKNVLLSSTTMRNT